jgi:N-acetylmuramoyl-L-alanine amidase
VGSSPRRRLAVAAGLAALLTTLGSCGSLSPKSSRVQPHAATPIVTSTISPRATTEPSSGTPTPQPPPASPTPTASASTGTKPKPTGPGPVIVIDPGHSGKSIRSTDKRTGLRDIDYPNYPEIYETFDVSSCVARGLRKDGYRVILTKAHALDSVSLAKRAAIADRAKAALAISVHDDHGQSAGFEATYDQRGRPGPTGHYPAMYRGSGAHRTVFALPSVAKESQRAAKVIAQARSRIQGRPVSVRVNIYTGRAPLEPGNLALVQLLTRRPWVYNEMGAKTAGSVRTAMSIGSETGYAKGLLVGVEAAVPLASGRVHQASAGAALLHGCLIHEVEPSSGRYSRPRAYLPYNYPR